MSAATTFRLELPDGTPADPPTFATTELNWKPGDTIFVGAGGFELADELAEVRGGVRL